MSSTIQRVQAARRGSSALDREVLTELGLHEEFVPMDSCPYWFHGEVAVSEREEEPTRSLSGVTALSRRLLPSWGWRVGQSENGLHCQAVLSRSYPTNQEVVGESNDPALAMTVALLLAWAEECES